MNCSLIYWRRQWRQMKNVKSSGKKWVWRIFHFGERFELSENIRKCRKSALEFSRDFVGDAGGDEAVGYQRQFALLSNGDHQLLCNSRPGTAAGKAINFAPGSIARKSNGSSPGSWALRVKACTSGRPFIFFKIEVTPIRKSLLFMKL